MFKKLLEKFKSKPVTPDVKSEQETTDFMHYESGLKLPTSEEALEQLYERSIQIRTPTAVIKTGAAMDSDPINTPLLTPPSFISPALSTWYSSQSYIGPTLCAILSQQWLIDKACTMPAEDAVRNDFEITVNDGDSIPLEAIEDLRNYDTQYKIFHNLMDFVRKHFMFGIRIALFKVDGIDYLKPFNLDGVKPGSYRGISQIDPYWLAPQLSGSAASDPSALDFYEPTYWQVGSLRVHKSHLVIINTGDVADILKPTYFYGGVPLPQKIYERVYQAERTANEGSQLALTKRTDIYRLDIAKAMQNIPQLQQKLGQYAYFRDNYGVKLIDVDENMERLDTALSDLDAVIMTQYQLVAAIANVPSTKLLGTSPKGFNSAGEYEEANYHEHLKSIQTHKLTPLLMRHYELLIRSEISPNHGISPFDFKINWNACDSMTAEEEANVNKMKSETAVNLANVGAIDGRDERERIVSDPDSGYNGLDPDAPVEPLIPEENELNSDTPDGDTED